MNYIFENCTRIVMTTCFFLLSKLPQIQDVAIKTIGRNFSSGLNLYTTTLKKNGSNLLKLSIAPILQVDLSTAFHTSDLLWSSRVKLYDNNLEKIYGPTMYVVSY